MGAVFVAASRFRDFHHSKSDITVGSLIGLICSLIFYHMLYVDRHWWFGTDVMTPEWSRIIFIFSLTVVHVVKDYHKLKLTWKLRWNDQLQSMKRWTDGHTCLTNWSDHLSDVDFRRCGLVGVTYRKQGALITVKDIMMLDYLTECTVINYVAADHRL